TPAPGRSTQPSPPRWPAGTPRRCATSTRSWGPSCSPPAYRPGGSPAPPPARGPGGASCCTPPPRTGSATWSRPGCRH
ncbi:MAG: hypothetical protein AVDCRST_MAG41-608, partial [uncultured Corynebacteriales bacterium]